ncbi:unnamed protein product [Ambrosiozyma monospora]|uniref:Unnamed protein product n=1 Tax=Ambrosiozyma monospora TaxID=43982 RepID=A0ACB5TA97_AMBMO|nr:unnamed protein product [Ambrosiozyma monospora]
MSKEEVKKLKAEMEAIEGESKTRKRRPKGQKNIPTPVHNDTNANDTSTASFQVDLSNPTTKSFNAKKYTKPESKAEAKTIADVDNNKASTKGKPNKDNNHNVAVQIDISGSSSNMPPPKKKRKSTQYHHSSFSHSNDQESKVIFNPLAFQLSTPQNSNNDNIMNNPSIPVNPSPDTNFMDSILPGSWKSLQQINSKSPQFNPTALTVPPSLTPFQFPSPIFSAGLSPDVNTNPSVTDQPKYQSGLQPGALKQPIVPGTSTQNQLIPTNSIQPLSLDSPEPMDSLADIFSPGFSKLLQERLRSDDAIEEIDEDSDHRKESQQQGQIQRFINNSGDNNFFTSDSGFNSQITKKTSSFSNLQELFDFQPSLKNAFFEATSKPSISVNPSIVTNTTLATLSPIGTKLYEYYRDRLGQIASSAPRNESMHLNTFLPMAHVDRSVLYGLLAWSAFHLGGPRMEKQGNYYIQQAIEGFVKRPLFDEENEQLYQGVLEPVDDNDEEITKEDEESAQQLQLPLLTKNDMYNMRLAAFMVLCGVEICKGDVSKWSKYLNYGAQLIQKKGGLKTLKNSKDEHFLASNYAYHDITSASTTNRELHFKIQEYEEMWNSSNKLGLIDPLHGLSTPIYGMLAEINNLVMHTKMILKRNSEALNIDGDEQSRWLNWKPELDQV